VVGTSRGNNPCFSFLLLLALAVSVSGLLRALDGEMVILCVRYWCTSITKICTSSVPSIFCCKFLFQLSFWTCFVWRAKLCLTLLLIYGSRYSDCRSLLRRYATLLSLVRLFCSFCFFHFRRAPYRWAAAVWRLLLRRGSDRLRCHYLLTSPGPDVNFCSRLLLSGIKILNVFSLEHLRFLVLTTCFM
jgi:hypothetical protein